MVLVSLCKPVDQRWTVAVAVLTDSTNRYLFGFAFVRIFYVNYNIVATCSVEDIMMNPLTLS